MMKRQRAKAAGWFDYIGDWILDWDGRPVGEAQVKATWPAPHASDEAVVHQVEASISGVVYTGRTTGHGEVWRGRAKARQPWKH